MANLQFTVVESWILWLQERWLGQSTGGKVVLMLCLQLLTTGSHIHLEIQMFIYWKHLRASSADHFWTCLENPAYYWNFQTNNPWFFLFRFFFFLCTIQNSVHILLWTVYFIDILLILWVGVDCKIWKWTKNNQSLSSNLRISLQNTNWASWLKALIKQTVSFQKIS